MKLALLQNVAVTVLTLFSFTYRGSAQKKATLIFNEEGKLTSGYLPRLGPFKKPCKPCKDKYLLSAKVLLPLDFFKGEKSQIDSMALLTRTAVEDSNSMLYKILNCGKNGQFDNLKAIVNNTNDILSWKIKDTLKEDQVIPIELIKYVRFIRILDSIRYKAGKIKEVNDLLENLNLNFKEFSPYRLKIKGLLLDTSCFRFVSYPMEEDPCRCVNAGKRYIAVEFGVPYSTIAKDASIDSFQIVQYFSMKKFAINWYNAMLKKYSKDVPKLKALEQTIKQNTTKVKKLLDALDELDVVGENCKPGIRDSLQKKWNSTICDLKLKLTNDLGNFNCALNCDSSNVIFCSKILPQWILKLVWLNGDIIRLNPFRFTNGEVAAVAMTESSSISKLKSKAIYNLENANASIKIEFWKTAIKHLQDSIKIMKLSDVDAAKERLDRLLGEANAAQMVIENNTEEQKDVESSKNSIASISETNEESLNGFTTISKVKYKGWFVPYRLTPAGEHDKMWLRNYYYSENASLLLDGKYHFTYPENENVTLLIHNLTQGSRLHISETIVPSTDSSTWTTFAVKAVANASLLYSSLGPVAPIVRQALKGWNSQVKRSATAEISNIGFTSKIFDLSSTDTIQLREFLNTPESEMGNVKIKVDKQEQTFQLMKNVQANITNIFNRVKEITNQLTVCITPNDQCYINYLKALLTLRSAPSIIEKELQTQEDSIPSYFTYRHALADSQATYTNKYEIRVASSLKADSLKQFVKTGSFIQAAKFHYLELAAGIAYTPNGGSITSIDTTSGNFKINRDEDKARLIAGVRIYPAGLYNLKNPVGLFKDFRWVHRLSILVATGFPKPLQNIYLGGGFDIFPGLTISAGSHWQQQNQFEISNNQIRNKSTQYRGHAFYSITMDPTILVSAITSLFKF